VTDFGLRWHKWRDVSVLVVRGQLDVDAVVELSRRIARLQRESGVFVDLWDVTFIDTVGVGVLETAKRRAEAAGWDFAVIAERGGPVARGLEAAGLADSLPLFPTKHDARAALRHR
jgi:anti-anti-sigma factor